MTDEERSLFQLAENLHVPVYELREKMPASEFFGWLSFYQHRADKDSGNLLADENALLKGLTGG